MATPAKVREQMTPESSTPQDAALRGQVRQLYWREAALSGWAPLGVFVLALVPYIALVELDTPAYHWAQPLLKGFGLAMIAWFVGLWILRFSVKRVGRVQRLRHAARELDGELRRVLAKHGASVSASTQALLRTQQVTVDRARVAGDADALEAALTKLSELMDKHLGALRKQGGWEVAGSILLWLGIAILIRMTIIDPYRIPSGSMIPTLEIGDQIFVNKFIYGVRIPWINKVPFVIVRPPQRGDVIVFNNPVLPSDDYIKRVIGLPGDRVHLDRDVVFINGVEQPRELLSAEAEAWEKDPEGWRPETVLSYRENLDGHPHVLLQRSARPRELYEPLKAGERGEYVVPPGNVFVMGDNRDNSTDSRYGLGGPDRGPAFVPVGNIKGKAMIVWLSLGHGGFLSGLMGGTGLRTDRLFLPVR